ncbi:vascular endothelial growth factor receptor 3-like isoform X2 [Folsomia candida]|uniref:vascular endothelial growth factor receptor 3-like isoform X2 n=1 Tax=Folsomia candida TaxID=158441 RepID=UPI0016053C6D|nr:vascular endothelial growth factor receptor 3-like isoform X2 [Folsomia candida]
MSRFIIIHRFCCIKIILTVIGLVQILLIVLEMWHQSEIRDSETTKIFQYSRIACEILMFLVGLVFTVSIRLVNGKLLAVCMPILLVLGLFRKMSTLYYICLLRGKSSSWTHHSTTASAMSFVTTMSYAFIYNWVLTFVWKNKICRITETHTEKFCGLRITKLLAASSINSILALIFLFWNRISIYINSDWRRAVFSEIWYTVCSPFLTLPITILLGMILYNLLIGLRQKSIPNLKRCSNAMWLFIAFFGATKVLWTSQERDVLVLTNVRFVALCILFVFNICHVLGTVTLLFLHVKNLKQARKPGNLGKKSSSHDTEYKSGKDELNIRSIPANRIKVEAISIGTGFSSTVHPGQVRSSSHHGKSSTTTPVAIKIVSKTINSTVIFQELKNMARLMIPREGKTHPNVIYFLGACFLNSETPSNPLGPVNIIMELCRHGSLIQYLRRIRDDPENSRDPTQLDKWSLQVANGMTFLAELNVTHLVHSDIAARNVLLDDKLVAKISDFGMSRKLYDYQMYATLEQKEYPWKWMAPESLDRLQFTHQSDVWSYGVLLWEIYSLGETPWPGLTWTSDFVHKLHNGLRLERPFWADKNIFVIMQTCWQLEPGERPTFSQISKQLLQDFIINKS